MNLSKPVSLCAMLIGSVGVHASETLLASTGEKGGTTVAGSANGKGGRANPVLDAAEETHLVFMRKEEKLARDVYLTLAQWYPEQTVFNTVR